LGCTLLSKKALALADFTGYDGKGTQDLYLCWHRWYPANIKIACVPHVVCDHVKPEKHGDESSKIIHYKAYHESDKDFLGHLRSKNINWIDC
jgi:hypothetical protein